MVTTNESPPQRQRSETKRSNKPIMEKRRRARINNCLNELKSLILDAMKKDSARHSKLEKADILEMTVKHVETLQRHQMALTAAADPSIVNKFKAGWGECVSEVGRFPGLDQSVRHRLMEHLSTCMESRDASSPTSWEHQPVVVQKLSQQSQATTVVVTTVSRQQCSPSPRSLSPQQQQQQQPPSPSQHPQPVTLAASPSPTMIQQSPLPRQGSIVALVPTRLPNGDIALVLPSPPPLATSNQPLSLVVNKSTDVEKPWRPW